MGKGIGFTQHVTLDWLDAAASYAASEGGQGAIRKKLENIIGQQLTSTVSARRTVDVLLHIWVKSAERAPRLHREAVQHYQQIDLVPDRTWLHYGLSLAAYPFFHSVVSWIGRETRLSDEPFSPATITRRIMAERGQLGSIGRAVGQVLLSLSNWGFLLAGGKRHTYIAQYKTFTTHSAALQAWLLACALYSSSNQEMAVHDLIGSPCLFPFQFTINANDLRRLGFRVQRQGLNLDMVSLDDI